MFVFSSLFQTITGIALACKFFGKLWFYLMHCSSNPGRFWFPVYAAQTLQYHAIVPVAHRGQNHKLNTSHCLIRRFGSFWEDGRRRESCEKME
jgi:hypothetical protein